MAFEIAKEAWDKLREEFMGSDTTRNMQAMNLRREFEMLRMQEVEKVKDYVDILMSVVNKVRSLGVEMTDKMIVEKVLMSLPERLLTKAVKNQTQLKLGVELNQQWNLRIFGSICCVMVPTSKRTKLDDKVEVGIFIGYSSQSKGYKVYIPESKKIVITTDVKMDETTVWNWEEKRIDEGIKPRQEETIGELIQEADFDEEEKPSVRGTRSLAEVYERCNLAMVEPWNYNEAAKLEVWKATMLDELSMIEKKNT
ncbi:uncharacterized protein LOC116108432 [Pistacia vera]|uniref:uncharacterized protein LOC116108432 n=1 Tax=Pistacia vera TaxID=55513 RepID=UPI001262AFBF|nr:uncharacterized protein LOC116108432 [Pistacia vera]